MAGKRKNSTGTTASFLYLIFRNHQHRQDQQKTTVTSHTRKKRGRKPLPDNLPRIQVTHDLSDEENQCQCGCQKACIGKEVSEQLDIIPARVRVLRHIRLKYACKHCEGVDDDGPTVSIARMLDQIIPIPKAMATPGTLAHILTGKFADALLSLNTCLLYNVLNSINETLFSNSCA
ncbi:MAG: IS66 family transposase zinc-finger binding domain-containing protein [Desulfobacterales bacterium]|nr:IS66 family transposase zinc-finger binding domain-containing protein [Desulfobacterales bacterium]